MDQPRFGPSGFCDVSGLGARNRHNTAVPRLAVIGGHGGGLLEGRTVRCLFGTGSQHYVAAGHASHMKPEIVGVCQFEAEMIVVYIRFSRKYFPAAR